jgi:hypothetical protein
MTDAPPFRVLAGEAADGTLTYLVDRPPAELPSVLPRDLLAAWDAARDGADGGRWGERRAFRFRRGGGWSDLLLADADACCWAAAVDRVAGLGTPYGLSLCLRLLALIELLGRSAWAGGLFDIAAGGTALHPALLRLAAEARLMDDGRFNEQAFRRGLASLPGARRMGASA